MSPGPDDLDALRAAKDALVERFGAEPWFGGAGIGRVGENLALRLNVDPAVEIDQLGLPQTFRGFAVELVRIKTYRPRG
ncbi:MAG TPA: hypothetical protein VGC54_10330 [Planctomycetota bacterium]